MKSAVALALTFLSTFAIASHGIVDHHRRQSCTTANMGSNPSDNTAGWVQNPEGKASFTVYEGCYNPCKLCTHLVLPRAYAERGGSSLACGGTVNGYSAAVNTLAFGADISFGDACGRCFKITATGDPYTPSFEGPFNSIVVKVNDLCPHSPQGSPKSWCDQKVSDPLNQFQMPMQCVLSFPVRTVVW